MRKLALFLAGLSGCFVSFSQYTLTAVYNQDFNSMLIAGSGNSLPTGWSMSETGSAADALYTSGTGSSSTGDTYSFGATSSPDRAFGALQSGTLLPLYGFCFTNATGQVITRLIVSYTGEQWRLGSSGRNDRLDFQFSLNATSLGNGDWVDLDILDFTSPVSTAPTGALDGNAAANKRMITATITGLQIAAGSTCFFRWVDQDASGADDGLAIDDLSIEPVFILPSTFYYRTQASGNWSSLNNWEVSADELSWSPATELPGQQTAGIRIRSGHSITHQYFSRIDQLLIEPGGLLQHHGGQLTIYDGAGDDLLVENAAVFQLSVAGNLPLFADPGATVKLKTGSILRISAGGLTSLPGAGVHASNYLYEHAAVLENAYNGMGANGVIYFPNVNSNTIPVLRITQPITLPVGAVAATRVNGVLEVNGNLSLTASGQKTVRNGIRGSATLTTTATCGLLVIDGATAVLGGSGLLNLSASGGLQTGSGTTITLLQDKTVQGNISLGAMDSYIDLGANRLTVSGAISGGGPSGFIRTAGTGVLTLENVPVAGKLFPVGHTRYNPVLIENGSGHHWSVRVNDGVVPDFPYTSNGAVLLTWHIQPAVDPPASGAHLTFLFDQTTQTGPQFNTPPFDTEPVQAWRRSNGYWLSAAVPQPLVIAGGDIRTVKFSGLTNFADFGLSRLSLPLPVKLISFEALPVAPDQIRLNWKIAEPGKALFLPEYSVNGEDYSVLDTIMPAETKTSFSKLYHAVSEADRYYRLKILEPDGHIHYSLVVKLKSRPPDDLHVQLQENPVTHDAFLTVKSGRSLTTLLVITDPVGKKVYQTTCRLQQGAQSVHIPIAALRTGIYFLRLEGNGWQRMLRFIKK